MALTPEDLTEIGKQVKNNVRVALDTYEEGEGQPLRAMVRAEVQAALSGLQHSLADLLYTRIADGTWEQLGKFGDERGYKPPKG